VFVRDPDFLKPDGPKAFHARAVTTGGRDERNSEILTGLSPGEIVATKAGGCGPLTGLRN
jgi:membrane fusion protein, heavy metal efflux system